MSKKTPPLGILQGRLTPSSDGSIQFFPTNNWFNEFKAASDIGFDRIELLVKWDSYYQNPFLVDSGIELINKLTKTSNLGISSVHAFYAKTNDYPPMLCDLVRRAAYFEARTILVSFFNQNKLENENDKTLAREQLGFALGVCSVLGVRLGIETEMPAMELLDFIKSFNHPNIGVYYDIGNMASTGVDVAAEIVFLSNYICGVHVKDRLPNGGKTVPFGEGCADFEKAFAALRDIDYGGPLIIQGARVPGVDDIELNRQYYKFCKNLLEKTYKGGEG